jgi:predicted dehydrogenase
VNPDGVSPRVAGRTRVGCLGVGWIGRQRMQALVADGAVEVVAIADPDLEARAAAAELVPRAAALDGLEPLLERGLDGIVIATPSALHATQATAALQAGAGVFCQKPLARTAAETRAVIRTAREENQLLDVDLVYRDTAAARALHRVVGEGEIGEIHAVELVFHNAYGPDKPWFTRRSQSGGGCLIDLGVHLLDLGLWLTGSRDATVRAAHLSRHGRPLGDGDPEEVEDFALAQLRTGSGAVLRIACSWFLPAGRECALEVTAYGTEGAVSMRNLDGSFYDFVAERFDGTRRHRIAEPESGWGGRAIVRWGRRLARSAEFDPSADRLAPLAAIIDDVYAAA